MAYRKTRKVNRSSGRKKFYKKYKSYRDMAYTAYKGVKFIKGLVNVENHLFDTVYGISAVPSTGTVINVNDVASGDGNSNRTGTSILPKHISWHGRMVMDPSVDTSAIRVILFRDLENHGALPAVADILENTAFPMVSPLKINNTDRFWILSDKKYAMTKGGREIVNFKGYCRLNFHMKYQGTGTGQYDTNSLFVLFISDHLGATEPTIETYYRLSFYDN